jgi:4'-phosphopantetheinyl transferase EntD
MVTPRHIAEILEAWLGPRAQVFAANIEPRPLFPGEERYVAGAVSKRLAEFATGRYCARQALAALGGPQCAIPMGRFREPVWPDGYVGAITHNSGLCAAVAARGSHFSALGIDILDIEEAQRTLAHGASLIATPEELSQEMNAWPGDPSVLLFGAKESAIKALSKSAGRFLDFPEVRLKIEGQTFSSGDTHGWWRHTDGLLITAAAR